MNSLVSPEFQEWASTTTRRESTVSTSTVSSASTSILFQSPATSPGSRKQSWQLYEDVIRLELNPHMTMCVLRSSPPTRALSDRALTFLTDHLLRMANFSSYAIHSLMSAKTRRGL